MDYPEHGIDRIMEICFLRIWVSLGMYPFFDIEDVSRFVHLLQCNKESWWVVYLVTSIRGASVYA